MRRVEQACRRQARTLAPIRRRMFELIAGRHAPIGAYDILGLLTTDVGALNAYIACEAPAAVHRSQFLVCRSCNRVTEFDDPDLSRLIARTAGCTGFLAGAQDVEIKGPRVACGTSAESWI